MAAGLAALGLLNLAGRRIGRILTFICQPVILVLGAVIMTRQVFLVADLEAAFAANPGLSSLDVQALVDAGEAAMPEWCPHSVRVHFALATWARWSCSSCSPCRRHAPGSAGQPVTVEDSRG